MQYFKSGYHFPLRYFIYAGITAMLRLIIVNHESSVDTILFAGAILIMVIALCLVLYSNKLKIYSFRFKTTKKRTSLEVRFVF